MHTSKRMPVNPLTGRSYERVCRSCHLPFVTGNARQVYCKQSCGIACAHCGKAFETTHRNRGRPVTCSPECHRAHVLVKATCEVCGEMWEQRNRQGGVNKTCSKTCRYELMKRSAHDENGNHYNWDGGRSITKQGYVKILMPEHPNANGSYVLEHRLIVERAIGRLLTDEENVHHKNGDRADNRLTPGHEFLGCPPSCCNLELWTTSQPSGQRVQDKVDWARAILRPHEPDRDLHPLTESGHALEPIRVAQPELH